MINPNKNKMGKQHLSGIGDGGLAGSAARSRRHANQKEVSYDQANLSV
jgi:hypothetical protein